MSDAIPAGSPDPAFLATLPEPARAAVRLACCAPPSDAAQLLVELVAATVHPDYLINLAMVADLAADHREAAARFLTHAFCSGFTQLERVTILQAAEERIARNYRLSGQR